LVLALSRGSDPALRVAGLAGLAAGVAWLIAPTSASGPNGTPHGFESGLRYLAPALVLGLAVLPAALRQDPPAKRPDEPGPTGRKAPYMSTLRPVGAPVLLALAIVGLVLAIAVGYPIQRHYLRDRYAKPTFTTPGLNAAFAWAQDISGARIATTSTRQYPLFGRDLSNHVSYIGEERPHGGFTAPTTCPQWRHLLNEGHYDYVVTSRDRIEPGKPVYPPTSRWTQAPGATVVLRKPPTVIFKLRTPLDPSTCTS
jgi:hypothetical protein